MKKINDEYSYIHSTIQNEQNIFHFVFAENICIATKTETKRPTTDVKFTLLKMERLLTFQTNISHWLLGLVFQQKGKMATPSTHEYAQATFVANTTKHFKLHPYFPRPTETPGSLCTTTTSISPATADFKMLQVCKYSISLHFFLIFRHFHRSNYFMHKIIYCNMKMKNKNRRRRISSPKLTAQFSF